MREGDGSGQAGWVDYGREPRRPGGRWMVVADVKGASSDFARSAAPDEDAAAAFDETAQKTMRENAE